MAVLKDLRTGKDAFVEADFEIGRSPNCALRLGQAYVSSHHANVRWTGSIWHLKDLGSRNGTLLNATRVAPGRNYDLKAGDILSFGHGREQWQLTDDSPPGVLVVPLGDGEPIVGDEDVLAIPNAADPQATLFHDVDGRWKLETAEGDVIALEPPASFEVGGKTYRFSCPEDVSSTASVGFGHQLGRVELWFSVSRDEEYVELRAFDGVRTVELGSRGHNYLLLTLARARLEDARNDVPEAACGWVYQEDLLRGLRMAGTQLNIDVFRIRQQFARAGLNNALSIVERRPRAKQLRIGTGALKIQVL